MDPIIGFEHIQMTMGGRRLLTIPELTLHPGECVVLRGANGSGKTTLLKILAGLLPPEHTTVRYRDFSLAWKKAKSLLREVSVYLHQHPYMFDRSVQDNVAYGLRRTGLSRAEADSRVKEALEWSNLSYLSRQNARSLSGGETQRVAFARARVLSPKILLLDEPTSNMDQASRQQAYTLISRLKDDGIAVLIASHEGDLPAVIAERQYHLSQGILKPSETPADAKVVPHRMTKGR